MILAGTGHRKFGGAYGDNPVSRHVCRQIGVELDRLKPEKVISGMALGFDQWLAAACVKRGVPFVAAIPFDGHDEVWTWEQRAKYHQLLLYASERVVVSTPTSQQRNTFGWAAGALHTRNRWMVDNSTVLLAAWDGAPEGGTWNCLQYARKVGREVVGIEVPR